ncbi:MAG: DNA polymerase III subunit delta [Rickettsiales bacterium]|jgi:DNA polymerase-3 subunit delta|nr:DNA polymerase III subunit delta [Rickettsiales bacterium]
MKWKNPDFEAALAKKFAGMKGVLLAGVDSGQIDENAGRILAALSIPKDCQIRCSLTELKSGSDRYFAEACSKSLFGDKRAIVVSELSATKGDAAVIKDLCENPSLDAFVILLGEGLKKDADVRKIFENSKAEFAALEHYLDTERDLPNIIRATLSEYGVIDISRDAMVYMSKSLGGDRGMTRRALEKLAMYVRGRSKVSLEDAENCIGDSGASAVDHLLYSMTAGRSADVCVALDRLFQDRVMPARIIRAAGRHLKNLMAAKSAGNMPVAFWKYKDLMSEAWNLWNVDRLAQVVSRAPEIERQLRGSKSEEAVISKFCLDISDYIAKFKRRA